VGRLVIEGRDKKMALEDHVESCVPCHLPNVDIQAKPDAST
jgi:hypothetical protein